MGSTEIDMSTCLHHVDTIIARLVAAGMKGAAAQGGETNTAGQQHSSAADVARCAGEQQPACVAASWVLHDGAYEVHATGGRPT
jgi:hypothetical protein